MKALAPVIALSALALTVVPAALFAAGMLAEPMMKNAMIAGLVLWFGAAPFWLKGGKD